MKTIGVLTSGGDAQGMNAAVRAVVRTCVAENITVMGIREGYKGLIEGNIQELTARDVCDILGRGGTFLRSARCPEFKTEEKIQEAVHTCKEFGIEGIVVIGGDGTLTSGRDFSRKGVKVIGVPKTIDNDLASTDTTFGFDTAVATATESIDRLRTTAESHSRVIVVEVMGRYAGFIAIASALAGGCDAALIPEVPYDINKVADAIKANRARGKNFALVVVAEGAKPKGGDVVVSKVVEDSPDPIRLGGIGEVVSEQLERLTGLESRATILGHVQRGGTPTANDRILSTRYGTYAVELLMQGKFGNMVVLNGAELGYDSLENVIGKNKAVEEDSYWIRAARGIGMCLGD